MRTTKVQKYNKASEEPSSASPVRYKIQLSSAAEKSLRKLDPHIAKKVFEDLKKLADNPRPHGYEQLTDRGKLYRWQTGPKKNYRVVHEIEDDQLIVLVLKVADRKDVYRDL